MLHHHSKSLITVFNKMLSKTMGLSPYYTNLDGVLWPTKSFSKNSLWYKRFKIEQRVRQECILSPHLFNIYSEMIMRSALDCFERNVTVRGCKISNLRYSNNIVSIASNMDTTLSVVDKVKTESDKNLFIS